MLIFPSSCAWLFLRAAAAAAATDVSECTHTPRLTDSCIWISVFITYCSPYYVRGTRRLGTADGLQESRGKAVFTGVASLSSAIRVTRGSFSLLPRSLLGLLGASYVFCRLSSPGKTFKLTVIYKV